MNLLKQYAMLKDAATSNVLFIQVGDSFEAYDEDARRVAKVCGLELLQHGRDGHPTVAFPATSMDSYRATLTAEGYTVGIATRINAVPPSVNADEVERLVSDDRLVENDPCHDGHAWDIEGTDVENGRDTMTCTVCGITQTAQWS